MSESSVTTHDIAEIQRMIDERISRAETRLMRWAVGAVLSMAVAVGATIFVAGRMVQRVDQVETRVTTLETTGSAPIRERLATIEAQLINLIAVMERIDKRGGRE